MSIKSISRIILYIAIFVLGIVILMQFADCLWVQAEGHTSYLEAILTAGSLIAAAVSVFVEHNETKALQEAEFVLNLNQAFVETKDYAQVYEALEYEYFQSIKDEDTLRKCIKPERELTRIQISNYLTFFESMYLLIKKKTLQLSVLNDLFGYRFFLAVHSELIQEEKLVSQPENFRNIYHLERIWMEYRKEQGMSIFREDNTLEKACIKKGKQEIYNLIMNKK